MLNKRMLKTIALLALPALFLFTACDPTAISGNGDIVTETRDDKDFTGLEVSVPGKVVVLSGSTFNVKVQAEENLLPYLKTDVELGNLHIYFSRNVRDVDGLVVTVTMPELKYVNLSGSAILESNSTFTGLLLDMDVSGSGAIKMKNVSYDMLILEVSGSGHIDMDGDATEVKATISGSGQVNTLDCPVKKADVHLSGSGKVSVNVSDLLIAHISGSGEVWYQGNPVVNADITGSGDLKKI